jgi:hypothetical protein
LYVFLFTPLHTHTHTQFLFFFVGHLPYPPADGNLLWLNNTLHCGVFLVRILSLTANYITKYCRHTRKNHQVQQTLLRKMVISLISKQTCLGLAKTQVFVPLFIIVNGLIRFIQVKE